MGGNTDKVKERILTRLLEGATNIGSKDLIDALEELRERRKNDKPEYHAALSWQNTPRGIVTVHCICGEVTEHRVPLKFIDDFKCPKAPKE